MPLFEEEPEAPGKPAAPSVPDGLAMPPDIVEVLAAAVLTRRKPMKISAEALAAVEAMRIEPDVRFGAELAQRFPRTRIP